jgi:hypothetical protein
VETVPQCDCHSAYQLGLNQNHLSSGSVGAFAGLECWVIPAEEEGSGSVGDGSGGGGKYKTRLDDPEILSQLNCEGAVIQVENVA